MAADERVEDIILGAQAKADAAKARNFRLGVQVYVGLAILLGLLAFKAELLSHVSRGETVTAVFANAYKLRQNDSSVKLAGLTVGTVTGVEQQDDGTALVTMKVEKEALEVLGSTPRAEIEGRTLLGGRYAIDLIKGGSGRFNGRIPISRTSAPVELDAVAEALPGSARQSLQNLAGNLGTGLKASDDDLNKLLKVAPDVLRPGADVLDAARGTHPDDDLSALVTDLNATAEIASRRDGRLGQIARDLNTVSEVLAERRNDVGETLENLPQVIDDTHEGLDGLTETIEELEDTAEELRPSAPKVADLMKDLDPTLKEARPLLTDLKALLKDARPAVDDLVPVATHGTRVFRNLHGPVLDRVNGPVSEFVLKPWKGEGPYEGGAGGYMADHKFYEELAYMVTNVDRASMSQDMRGTAFSFQAGVGLNSVSDLPFDYQTLVTLALDQAGVTGVLRSTIFEALGLLK